MQKLLIKFHGLATSDRRNPAMITDRRKVTSKCPSTGCLVSFFSQLESIQSLSLGCTLRTRKKVSAIRQRLAPVRYENRTIRSVQYGTIMITYGQRGQNTSSGHDQVIQQNKAKLGQCAAIGFFATNNRFRLNVLLHLKVRHNSISHY